MFVCLLFFKCFKRLSYCFLIGFLLVYVCILWFYHVLSVSFLGCLIGFWFLIICLLYWFYSAGCVGVLVVYCRFDHGFGLIL